MYKDYVSAFIKLMNIYLCELFKFLSIYLHIKVTIMKITIFILIYSMTRNAKYVTNIMRNAAI